MTPRDRRALIWGGAAVVGAILVLRVVPWTVRAVAALRVEAVERVQTVARANDVLAGAAATRDTLAQTLGAVVALAPRLIEGRTAAEAQASLSGLVSLAASRHALRVMRLDPLPDSSSEGAFNRVAVHVELEGDVAGLTRFLGAVEKGDPLLTLPALSVQATDPVGRLNAPEQLKIEATVVGLFLSRGSK
ncbi:MAG TPA: type II secretion system protein GspM [Gemmatimonadales bacterium]|nr:type II secretion system protein GspM [Gemmatimonadales bacterium]